MKVVAASALLLVASAGANECGTNWYPDWEGGSGTCKNNGNAPVIMQEHSGYCTTSKNECCARYYTGDAKTHCEAGTAQDTEGTLKWYVKWNDNPGRCAKDCPTTFGDPACGGVLGTSSNEMKHSTVTACCGAHFQTKVTDYCVTVSQGEEYAGSKDWYLDSSEHMCVQDCDGAAPCGGVIEDTWQPLYDSNTACCTTALSGLDVDFCTGQTDASFTGTNKWFLDGSLCKKDCTGTGTQCSRADQYDTLYDDSAKCCSGKLNWMNQDYCKSRSDPDTHGSGGAYTDKWFVDYSKHLCKKDCGSSDPACGTLGNDGGSVQLYDTAAACCSAKLSYIDGTTCGANSAAGTTTSSSGSSQWYADYASKKRCVMDCAASGTSSCGGVITNGAGVQTYGSAEECCKARFGYYDQDRCEAVSLAGALVTTSKWYVKYGETVCAKDCATGNGDDCGGIPTDLGTPMYDSVEACCKAKLGWIDSDSCKSKSQGGPTATDTGTAKYYALYSKSMCGKDCAVTASDPACAGIASSSQGHQMYDDAEKCCTSRFSYINKDYCKVKSESGGNAYSNLYYADQGKGVCYQDCATSTSTPCNGGPSDKASRMYTTIADCCKNSLGWVDKATCEQVPESSQGTDEWYINWQASKCVKNCATSSGDAACGGLAKTWDVKYSSASTCCKQPAMSWKKQEDCQKS